MSAARPDAGSSADSPGRPGGPVGAETVEAVVRGQLSRALGGRRGMVEGALPTIGFTVTFLTTHRLPLSLAVGLGLAVSLLLVRLAARQSAQYVANSLVGIGVAAIVAARSGRAEDVFLPGIVYNAVYALLLSASVLLRWPLVGLMIGSVTGDVGGWRADPAVVRLCSRLTWLLVLPCAARVAVQLPLWAAGQVGWLAVAKIAMGWPLQVAALGAMVYLLARGHTPLRDHAATT